MFLELSMGRCAAARRCPGQESALSSPSTSPSRQEPTWTEPAKCWRKVCLLACVGHTVLAGDARWKRRPNVNSTFSHTKKMFSLSICYKCPPPGRNWTKALEKRHPILIARRVRALDWNRHEKNTYRKITHWFEVIKDVLQNLDILAENVYNMDETESTSGFGKIGYGQPLTFPSCACSTMRMPAALQWLMPACVVLAVIVRPFNVPSSPCHLHCAIVICRG